MFVVVSILCVVMIVNFLVLLAISSFLTAMGEAIKDLQKKIDEMYLYVVPESPKTNELMELQKTPSYEDPRYRNYQTSQEMVLVKDD